ncbi:MAG: hypothetical protein A2Y94_11775 [Caldithrix sp. RBG_13_44_9]|nr:MAG: hypothetical protein A2Y94_11775 [Caldithrix sp. RBG_13_44_9]
MAVTLRDIARKAGISTSTASRVLNGKTEKYRISQKTQILVQKAAQQLAYRPNQLARGLRLKKTHTIGLVLPDISNPFFAYVARIIQIHAFQAGYSLFVCNTDENQVTEIKQIELLLSYKLDGLIIMPVGVKYEHILRLVQEHLPFVLIDRSFDEIDANSVVVDNYSGAYKAVEHLIENGHHRIAIIQGLPDTYTNTARVKGYRDALSHYHIPVDPDLIVGNDFRQENGYIETKLLLKLETPPTALFTTSDLITLGALQAIYEEHINVPKDISLVAFDDVDFAPYLLAPLSAVQQPKELMGEIAVKLLINDMRSKGKFDKKRIVLEPKLMIRKSVLRVQASQPVAALSD